MFIQTLPDNYAVLQFSLNGGRRVLLFIRNGGPTRIQARHWNKERAAAIMNHEPFTPFEILCG